MRRRKPSAQRQRQVPGDLAVRKGAPVYLINVVVDVVLKLVAVLTACGRPKKRKTCVLETVNWFTFDSLASMKPMPPYVMAPAGSFCTGVLSVI